MIGRWGGCCRGFWGGLPGGWSVNPLLSLIVSVLVVIGLVLLVIWVVRSLAGSAETGRSRAYRAGKGVESLEILQARYARGEITREEYLEMKADLS
jgi:putative membrane protein